jgi:hypothetical protein
LSSLAHAKSKIGRPSALKREQPEFAALVTRARFTRRESVTNSDRMSRLEFEFGVCLLPDILRKTIDTLPQEASRLQCNEEEINQHYEYLEMGLEEQRPAAIYKGDEAGFNA